MAQSQTLGAEWFAQAGKLLVLPQERVRDRASWDAALAVGRIPLLLLMLPSSQREGHSVSNTKKRIFWLRTVLGVTQCLAGLP